MALSNYFSQIPQGILIRIAKIFGKLEPEQKEILVKYLVFLKKQSPVGHKEEIALNDDFMSNINKKFPQFEEEIDLSNSNIDDQVLFYLRGIREINLSHCREITNDGLQSLKGVYRINLAFCDQITDEGLWYLQGVHAIDLEWCDRITDRGLQYLIGVHTIKLKNCSRITDHGLSYFSPYSSPNRTGARIIDISRCSEVTDCGVYHLSEAFEIDISFCNKITDRGIRYLENILSHLVRFIL